VSWSGISNITAPQILGDDTDHENEILEISRKYFKGAQEEWDYIKKLDAFQKDVKKFEADHDLTKYREDDFRYCFYDFRRGRASLKELMEESKVLLNLIFCGTVSRPLNKEAVAKVYTKLEKVVLKSGKAEDCVKTFFTPRCLLKEQIDTLTDRYYGEMNVSSIWGDERLEYMGTIAANQWGGPSQRWHSGSRGWQVEGAENRDMDFMYRQWGFFDARKCYYVLRMQLGPMYCEEISKLAADTKASREAISKLAVGTRHVLLELFNDALDLADGSIAMTFRNQRLQNLDLSKYSKNDLAQIVKDLESVKGKTTEDGIFHDLCLEMAKGNRTFPAFLQELREAIRDQESDHDELSPVGCEQLEHDLLGEKEEQLPKKIPDRFFCPLTGKVMKNPVTLSYLNSHSSRRIWGCYEREAIEEWLRTNSQAVNKHKFQFVANHDLKQLIDEFLLRNPKSRASEESANHNA